MVNDFFKYDVFYSDYYYYYYFVQENMFLIMYLLRSIADET